MRAGGLGLDGVRSLGALRLTSARIPTSFEQERFWFLQQVAPESRALNLRRLFRLNGAVDTDALDDAIARLTARHSSLRTVFASHDGRQFQVVLPSSRRARLHVKEVPAAAGWDDERLVQFLEDYVEEPFDLEEGPLFRPLLFRLGSVEQVLALVAHHCVADGSSMEILVQDFFELYHAALEKREAVLSPLTVTYAEYATEQRARLESGALADEIAFWRAQLAGAPPAAVLPGARLSRSRRPAAVSSIKEALAAEVREAFYRLTATEGVTPSMVGLAVLAVFLRLCTGKRDVVIGTPVAARMRPELRALVGCFENMLPLRIDTRQARTFRDVLAIVRTVVFETLPHRELPFERIAEELVSERPTDENPLASVAFGFETDKVLKYEISGVDVRLLPTPPLAQVGGFSAVVGLVDEDGVLKCEWTDSRELIDDQALPQIVRHFARLVELVITTPDVPLTRLSLVGADEKHRLTIACNRTEHPVRSLRVDQLVAHAAAQSPDAPAVECNGQVIPFRLLEDHANRLAWMLRDRALAPEAPVGILLEPSFELVYSMLGVLRAGAAYVALNPRYSPHALKEILDDCGTRVVVTSSALTGKLPPSTPAICLDLVEKELAALPAEAPESRASPKQVAYICYAPVSGEMPKGIAVAHREVVNAFDWANQTFRVGPTDRLLLVNSPSLDFAVYDTLGMLAAGGSVVVADDERLADPRRLLQLLNHGGITIWSSPPALLQRVVRAANYHSFPASGLRLVLLSRDWIPVSLLERTAEAFPAAMVVALGGTGEPAIWSSSVRIGESGEEWTSFPCGLPIWNARSYVLDERLEVVPEYVAGELCIGGEVLARGYYGRSALTAERFVPDPFSSRPGARMFRTGQRALRFGDGKIGLLGTPDEVVDIGGTRVELRDIEAGLDRHPLVDECIVVARGPAGGRCVSAYLGVRERLTAEELRSYLAQQVPDSLIPAAFVMMDSLPVTVDGMYDRTSPALELTDIDEPPHALTTAALPPTTRTQQAIVEICSELLERDEVELDDNFFEIGGHSLLALQVVLRVRWRLGVDVPLRALLERPTLRAFAAEVEEAGEESGPQGSLVPLKGGAGAAAVFLVHPIGGSVECYRELASLLGDCQVLGFEARGAVRGGIEGMAAAYAGNLRTSRPRVPYILGGWSLGAAIALRMAIEIGRDGTLPPVLLLDPAGVERPLESRSASDRELLTDFVRDLLGVRGLDSIDVEEALQKPPAAALEELAAQLSSRRGSMDLGHDELIERFKIFKDNRRAIAAAGERFGLRSGEVYGGRVHLVEAAETPSVADIVGSLCPNLSVTELPGHHFELLRGGNTRRVAAIVKSLVDQHLRTISTAVDRGTRTYDSASTV